ncbi:MAG: 16S rRNA (cytosine(1402)-N(4))-methyltransferase RsmH [Oscillospiraceae bacterium]|jgi:16S rRNA (cytosine1402-N4)-methyltransferase|nr:16S rRNA (cytosine(1402)-N(4))-methyltransferase RsmH [Oscillospiraceae bacterium]
MEEFSHIPVLLKESTDALVIMPKGVYIDCTVGGGGHSHEIAKLLNFQNGCLLCLDKDRQALEAARERLREYPAVFINDCFSNIKEQAQKHRIKGADGILMDLGVSSHQLDSAERGFSFHENAALDMRMNKEQELSAFDVVNNYSAEDLIRILFLYGEEKFARGIAGGIVKMRETALIKTTGELAEIIKNNVPLKVRREKNPCRKTFQAIRIEVNNELEALKSALPDAFELLNPGGRLAIITFHSLEDRIVKKFYKELAAGCTCSPDFPICTCNNEPKAKIITRKPITAAEAELSQNSRSRSAKLRVIEKIKRN